MRRLSLLPTASAIERVLACPSSAVLPQIFASVGEDAERGSAIGRFARDVLAGEPYDEVLARVPRADWRATCAALDFEAVCGDLVDVRAEVAYGVDPSNESARLLGLNLGRKYPALAVGELAGTNDLEGRTADGRQVVCDLKSGREVTACAANPQMMFHALARYYLTGAAEIEARILYVREDGRVFRDAHVFTPFELELFADRLAALPVKLEQLASDIADGAPLPVSSGSWCKYCPALQACPAHVALARVVGNELAAAAAQIAAMTPAEAGQAWVKAKRAEKLLAVVLDGLKGYAVQTPLDLGNGKQIAPISTHSTSFAQGQAIALLREKGATQAEIDGLFVQSPHVQVREVNVVRKPKAKRRRAA